METWLWTTVVDILRELFLYFNFSSTWETDANQTCVSQNNGHTEHERVYLSFAVTHEIMTNTCKYNTHEGAACFTLKKRVSESRNLGVFGESALVVT